MPAVPHLRVRRLICVLCCASLATVAASSLRAAEPVKANAVLSVGFEEPNGNPAVSVAGFKEPFAARLSNGPTRVPSPFWNQSGKNALKLDAAKKQRVQLVDIPYLDRPDAVTLSLFFLSLQSPSDPNPHGILAKRSEGPRGTNYGINYVPNTDVFQIYVSDGRGFHIASYSARQVIGSRRLVHLIATLEVGDAPAPDMDNARDDVLARLYVNGEPVAPKSVTGGDAVGADAWFTNLKIPGLLNDAPLTLGSSTPQTEYASCVIDEFQLFSRALSPAEAQRLFLEMAGPNGPQYAKRELEYTPPAAPPAVASISQLGLQMGTTTRLVVNGSNFVGNPQVDLPIAGLKQVVVHGSTANRLVVDLTLPSDVPPGIYPLSVMTSAGISKAVGVAVDSLSQQLVGDSAPDRPATLPAAFSGLITAASQSRVYFNGKAGARVVAEVEAKRIGSSLEPVLEVKNNSGRSLAIEWGKSYLRGDARAELTLPADGLYYAELHDLAYNAPTDSPFRLLVGDFRAVDAYFPPVVERGSTLNVEPVGTGIPAGLLIAANLKNDPIGLAKLLVAPRALHAAGPLPPLRISDGLEILQVQQPGDQLQTVDARFADMKHPSIAISGRLARPEAVDRYLLAVTPGQTLTMYVDGRSLNSPVDGHITILSYPEGKQLAVDGGTPGATTAGFSYQVPAGVSNVQVAVRDLLGRGGKHFVYRLRIVPAGRPDFNLALLTSPLEIPQNGRMLAELRVDRKGYAGPINLKVEGDDWIVVSPKQLPAEGGNRNVLVAFEYKGDKPLTVRRLRLVGESVDVNPPVHRMAVVAVPNQPDLAGFRDMIPAATPGRAPLAIDMAALPPALLKGVDTAWPLAAVRASAGSDQWLRLSLVSTEQSRRVDPNDRGRGKKPLVAMMPDQVLATSGKGMVKIAIPVDIAEPAIDFAIKADVVSNPYSDQVEATIYSNPFRMLVQDPVSLNLDGASLNLVGGRAAKIRGKLNRNPAFKQNVTVALAGLPQGYAGKSVTVAGDKTDFEIPLTVPNEAAARSVPNVSIAVTLADNKVSIKQPIELKVAPPAPPASSKKAK